MRGKKGTRWWSMGFGSTDPHCDDEEYKRRKRRAGEGWSGQTNDRRGRRTAQSSKGRRHTRRHRAKGARMPKGRRGKRRRFRGRFEEEKSTGRERETHPVDLIVHGPRLYRQILRLQAGVDSECDGEREVSSCPPERNGRQQTTDTIHQC
ncbi:uncharacterized protein BJX67DRAFT_96919 [Aspergillus lucknowensis]|uniref:Uncharacterized protein n=1 Tax=Aspergillus lucknowensis TaxID=176173 RepID=A0ABR4M669_9EURO